MAKTLEQVLKEQIGAMAFQIAAQSIEIETLREQIEGMRPEAEGNVGAQFIAPSEGVINHAPTKPV